jgi:DNA-binding transcriptional ArsR family regulator
MLQQAYCAGVATAFDVLADPGRRRILDLLCAGERPVGDIVERLDLSQPAVSKHLRVLRDAGFVEARIDAQRRVYRLRPQALREVDAWLAPYRALWTASLDRLEQHLDVMDPPPASATQKKVTNGDT